MSMETLENVMNDARRMVCNILAYESKYDEWPVGADICQMGAYKAVENKSDMIGLLAERGMIEIVKESAHHAGVRRRYLVTEAGRSWVMPPDPLPPVVFSHPVPLPTDEVEYRIYAYHHTFFCKYGRWPNGEERANAFGGQAKRISPARRRQAYEDLVADGTMVNVTFWNGRGKYNCYIIVRYSPEYADKHGMLIYAPLDKV